ncbi:MAG: DUF2269 domain-containing protein [Acidimicrobiia bacterium]|nr:DUF2269 domain-containing protein [Acidimicrobiia bacterium]
MNTGIYKFVLVLHILVAIIGFGTVFLNGLYGRQASSRRGPEGLAVFQATLQVGKVAEYFIYAVFVTGFLLVPLSDDAIEFGDTWVSLSMGLYIVALAFSHLLHQPNLRRMEVLMTELAAMGPPPGAGGPPPGSGAGGPGPESAPRTDLPPVVVRAGRPPGHGAGRAGAAGRALRRHPQRPHDRGPLPHDLEALTQPCRRGLAA